MPSRPSEDTERLIYGREDAEFGRTIAFGDAVFAVAITILVLGLEVPRIGPDTDVWTELLEVWPQFMSYLISFAVIGLYWVQNHRFVGLLERMSYPFIWWLLAFLLGISLVSFGTRFLSANATSPGAITVYAILIAYVSFMEGLGHVIAYHDRLYRSAPSRSLHRFTLLLTSMPGFVFLLSIPFAFLIGSNAAFLWFLTWPAIVFAQRYEPQKESEEAAH